MALKMVIPVVDTERGKFEYNGRELSSEEYGNMEYEKFRRTDRQVGRFVYNMSHGISNFDDRYSGRMRNVSNEEHPDIFFKNEEVDVIVYDGNRKEVTISDIENHALKGDMFLLILNIDSNTLSADAESELRFWIKDSTKVIDDNSLPDNVKIKTLLGRDYAIKDEEKTIWVTNCKMVQNFSNRRYPFYFAIIIEKAFIEK